MAWTNFVNGTTADADEVNANFDIVLTDIFQISTTSDLDISIAGSSSDENSFELDAISGDETIKYVKIEWLVYTNAQSYDENNTSFQWKLEHKETGDAYADVFSYETVVLQDSHPSVVDRRESLKNVVWYYTPDAGEKTNGFQLQMNSKAATGATCSFSCTNRQIIVTIIRTSD